ncbi:MAG TPA: hypothetical protein VHK69_15860 [Chitinophagaceae bacterium]|jgi:uncharacterized membrane protein YphA (DoxX/SURF4 family)|nr:hypothetical protein [Chitinophagaceae bacterium]
MPLLSTLDRLHLRARANQWLRYFTVFTRIALAAGFLPSGMVKILGERFTSLNTLHPMGHYLEAVHRTGYYYTFVGGVQVGAALLLLIPRTATLGAFLYFPVILNICILSLAVRFDGSLLTSPLMVLANLYLLCWDYHKWKHILPFRPDPLARQPATDQRFPVRFFAGVGAAMVTVALLVVTAYDIRPHNTLRDCRSQCAGSGNAKACSDFCDCIHKNGQPLEQCLEAYNRALAEGAGQR